MKPPLILLASAFLGLCIGGPFWLRWVGSHPEWGRALQAGTLAAYAAAALLLVLWATAILEGRDKK